MSNRILIIDDEKLIRESLTHLLSGAGYRVEVAGRVADARELVAREIYDLILIDLRLPDGSGIDLLRYIHEQADYAPLCIMMTAYGSVDTAVEAMKYGAYDYINKPFKSHEILLIVKLALETGKLKREVRDIISSQSQESDIISVDPAMERVMAMVRKVARNRDVSVLIRGESGTGKELVARALHRLGNRADKPLLTINCAALHEGLLESELFGHVKGAFTGAVRNKPGKFALADGGTLFLDEIGDMPLSVQAKLLRVLVSGEFQQVGGEKTHYVDVRIIAANNKDLRAEVQAGGFREDLYYRLNVVQMTLPPLRERPGDIPLLVKHFCQNIAHREQRPPLYPEREAMRLLEVYAWPGNVRELENLIERAVIYAGDRPISIADLPDHLRTAVAGEQDCVAGQPQPMVDPYAGKTIREVEKEMILAALQRCPSKAQAARELGISVRKIEYRLKEWQD
jgi:DNA-binding NtrC family response regulator